MTLAQSFIGIDISLDFLDIFDDASAKHSRIANDEASIASFAAAAAARSVTVIFEATGSYDRRLAKGLDDAKVSYVRVNPARARDFARAAGRLAKTDALDARVLAAMGRAIDLKPAEPGDPERQRLAALHKRRDQLVEQRADEKKRVLQTSEPLARESIENHIRWLKAEIATLDRAIAHCVAASQDISDAKTLLETAPGVGPVTAITLIAQMPELGRLHAKAIAALAGLAPFNNDSGAMRGKRSIKGGRRRVRRALYMAAISAIRSCGKFRTQYQEILKRSNKPKIAIIAIARKLLVTLNAMAKSKQAFKNT